MYWPLLEAGLIGCEDSETVEVTVRTTARKVDGVEVLAAEGHSFHEFPVRLLVVVPLRLHASCSLPAMLIQQTRLRFALGDRAQVSPVAGYEDHIDERGGTPLVHSTHP